MPRPTGIKPGLTRVLLGTTLTVGLRHREISMLRLPHIERFMTERVLKHDRGYTAEFAAYPLRRSRAKY